MDIHIRTANEDDYTSIGRIGKIAVEASHRGSCSEADMNSFLDSTYNAEMIKQELNNAGNLYHVMEYQGQVAGFSKIILNAVHPNIQQTNATKLDRIYLLEEYYDKKLGLDLLRHNIALSKQNNQSGMWLFTWQGNERAVNFYKKAGFAIVGTHQFKVTETHYNHHYQMLLLY